MFSFLPFNVYDVCSSGPSTRLIVNGRCCPLCVYSNIFELELMFFHYGRQGVSSEVNVCFSSMVKCCLYDKNDFLRASNNVFD